MSIRDDIIVELIDAVDVLITDENYDCTVDEIKPYHVNALGNTTVRTVLMVVDEGNEPENEWTDDTDDGFEFDVQFVGLITGIDDWNHVRSGLNELTGAIKQFINAGPDLGDHVLSFRWVENVGNHYDYDNKRAWTEGRASIIYYCTKGTY